MLKTNFYLDIKAKNKYLYKKYYLIIIFLLINLQILIIAIYYIVF